jgi:hypothetical protein
VDGKLLLVIIHGYIQKKSLQSIEDVDVIHYGEYSEVRSNIRMKRVNILNATFFKKQGEPKLYDYIHISGYKIRSPFINTPGQYDVQINTEVIGGGFQTFHGPSATGYDIGYGWWLNPWSPWASYGSVNVWEMTPEYPSTPIVDRVTPDTNWHSLIFILDQKNDHGYVLFDNRVYEVHKILRSYHPEWRGEGIDGGLVVEVSNGWPKDHESSNYRYMGVVQVKDWFWIWQPYNEEG